MPPDRNLHRAGHKRGRNPEAAAVTSAFLLTAMTPFESTRRQGMATAVGSTIQR
jgi:hypothetical protein